MTKQERFEAEVARIMALYGCSGIEAEAIVLHSERHAFNATRNADRTRRMKRAKRR